MQTRLALTIPLALALSAAMATGCTKPDPKPDPDTNKPKTPQAIPSDFVLNDFFVADAGPGNAADPTGNTDPTEPTDPLAAAASPAGNPAATAPLAHPSLKVVDPGAEPKVKRRYDLKTGRAETIKVTLQTTLTESQGAEKQSMAQPPIVLTMAVTPAAKTADGVYTIGLKLVKSDVGTSPGDSAQTQQLAKRMGPGLQALAGLSGTFTMDARGSLGPFVLGANTNPQLAQAADKIVPLIQQALEGSVVEFPEDAVGKGAHWQEVTQSNTEGVNAKVTTDATLTDATGDGVSVTVKTTRNAPPQQVADPRAPKGTTVAIDGTSTTTVATHLDHLVKKAQGDALTKATVNDSGAAGAAGAKAAPPTTSVQVISVKQLVEGS